jgi:hypothetical protein
VKNIIVTLTAITIISKIYTFRFSSFYYELLILNAIIHICALLVGLQTTQSLSLHVKKCVSISLDDIQFGIGQFKDEQSVICVQRDFIK